jgi:mRNA-degrading endonuclease RelE of RelBE toxin-antitoxin system
MTAKYDVVLTPDAKAHLDAFRAVARSAIVRAIEANLCHQPFVGTKNRKLLRPNILATWELRVGAFRVYYRQPEGRELTVEIVAIGVKLGSTVVIGGEEIEL